MERQITGRNSVRKFVAVKIGQVVLLAIKNRKLPLPENSADLYEISDKESSVLAVAKIAHTDQFR